MTLEGFLRKKEKYLEIKQLYICFHFNVLTNVKRNILTHLPTTQTTSNNVEDIVSKAHSSKMIVKASCMCESVRSSLVLLQPVTLCSEGKEDKQHNHLFSISICTLHTRSLARVKICLML